MSKEKLNLLSILEAIEKLEKYSSSFTNAEVFYADEVWEIINTKLHPLKTKIINLIKKTN